MGAGSEDDWNVSPFVRFIINAGEVLEAPVIWFREKIVTPYRTPYPYYHQKFPRVPTIDQCYDDDSVCKFEANEQFKRDQKVDSVILHILRDRWSKCVMYQGPDQEVCLPLRKIYEEAEEAWFSKYGDMGYHQTCETAYMRQKHRMIWERRHGKIGSGMNPDWKPAQPSFTE
ncbi:hypothetical protein M8J76_002359 [Diaphorina citri]|nr:hypothetical protein M8J75_014325 [Diaphorina citri]KAI5723170.1 hypothetical protein M8J76_002359 [Diaphorina citri]KAI5728981.1 hypothetical protein M8J77_023888 [Diaphorina citri]